MKAKALIGHTGFVGGNLDSRMKFTHKYNSKNIAQIDGHEFDQVVCAGVPGVKWLANKAPEQDKQQIDKLIRHLDAIRTSKFILISTIDVYPQAVDVDESSTIDLSTCHAYGKHRLQLENWISERFDALIIRLPGLFGSGLKKNIIFDLLNGHEIDKINPGGVFQFYYLDHIADDISIALKHDIRRLNISSEPVTVDEISEICIGKAFVNTGLNTPAARYDYKSVHAERFGGHDGYLYSKKQVLDDLKRYVKMFGSVS